MQSADVFKVEDMLAIYFGKGRRISGAFIFFGEFETVHVTVSTRNRS